MFQVILYFLLRNANKRQIISEHPSETPEPRETYGIEQYSIILAHLSQVHKIQQNCITRSSRKTVYLNGHWSGSRRRGTFTSSPK